MLRSSKERFLLNSGRFLGSRLLKHWQHRVSGDGDKVGELALLDVPHCLQGMNKRSLNTTPAHSARS
jgi:hypothetical protein